MRFPLAFTTASLWVVAEASTCKDETFNATGSLTGPGPIYNDTSAAYQLTLSNFVTEHPNPDAPHVSVVGTQFALQTSPFQNFSSPSTPFTGCLIAIHTYAADWPNGIHDDGTCSAVLDPDCLSELIATINSTASQISGSPNSTSSESCNSLMSIMNETDNGNKTLTCHAHWWPHPIHRFLSDPNFETDPACIASNKNTSDTPTPLYQGGWTSFSDAEGDYLAYDGALAVPVPLMVTMWSKPGGKAGWADTKIMCVPGNQTIGEGSRNVGADKPVAEVSSRVSSVLASLTATSTSASSTGTVASTSATSISKSGGERGFSVGVGVQVSLVVVLVVGLMV